jgi:hypothetical protein
MQFCVIQRLHSTILQDCDRERKSKIEEQDIFPFLFYKHKRKKERKKEIVWVIKMKEKIILPFFFYKERKREKKRR